MRDARAPDVERVVAILAVDHDRQEFTHFTAVALDKGFAPLTEGHSPGILPAASSKGVQLLAFGAEAPDAMLVHAHDAPGSLHP